ncbi:MAG TPA: cytochrome c oxidase assembly protein [Propionibacteriaceae bacterium]
MAALPFVVALAAYGLAVAVQHARGNRWPLVRSLAWLLGVLACLAAVTGPVAQRGQTSFSAHMVSHLLLGMVGPLLLARGAPVTLALRSLDVRAGRRLVWFLGSRPLRLLSHPVTAGLGGIAGLWLLYDTGLYARMQADAAVHLLVLLHVFAFGYLFAAAIVGVDPDRHRPGFGHRSVVLVLYVAAHSMLAKHIYAEPPVGVATPAAELGAQIMYYGGDAVHLALFALLWHRWYVTTGPRPATPRLPMPRQA